MGGGKKNKTKKKKTKVQEAAAKRHETFKKIAKETGKRVQTYGGTRKNYSKSEARAIEKAMGPGSFSKVTKGAKNPLKRAPYSDVKAGPLMPAVKDFNESLGNDYSKYAAPNINYNYSERPKSDISFGDAVRAGARFNAPGRSDLTGGRNVAMLPGDNMGSIIGTGAALGFGLSLPGMVKNAIDAGGKLKENIEKKLNPEDVSSTGIGDMSNLVSSTNLSGLGMTPKTSSYDPGSTAFALRTGDFDPASYEKFKASQETAGGLNIGSSAFGLDSETSDRIGRALRAGPSDYNMVDGGDVTFRDVLQADNMGNAITRNINKFKSAIPILNMLPDMPLDSMARADSRAYLGYNPNLPTSVIKQRGGIQGTGGRVNSKGVTRFPTVIEQILPEAVPVPSASTTPATQTGVDPNRLLQIQQQAYAQAYNPMLIGGFNPQFRLGAASSPIDYSTYFNY